MEEQVRLANVKFMKNAYIIVEGDKSSERFFIIREGRVYLSRNVQVVAEERGNVLGPGDFFGVVSTMSGLPHIETAKAITDVGLISVEKEQFGLLIQNNAPVAKKVLLQFSKRMRFLNESLTRLTLKKTANINTEHLFSVAEYYSKQKQFNQAVYAYNRYIKHCPNGVNIRAAHEHLRRITSYAKAVKMDFKPDEQVRIYPKEAMIFSEGEPGEEVFIIKSGLVKIAKVVGDGEVVLAILKTGDIFGEMAVLDSTPRGACAIAFEECQLTVINKENFQQMIYTQSQLIARLTGMLAERIWLAYKQLANTRIFDPIGRMYDMLYIHLEKKRVDFDTRRTFIFDFGVNELIGMVGLSPAEGNAAVQKFLQNRYISIIHNKISIQNVFEFSRQVMYYRKMQEGNTHRRR